MELLEVIRRRGLEPNVITYKQPSVHLIIQTFAEGIVLIQEMQRKDLEPDVITYSTAISACEKSKQSEKAL